jgi:hypothetical protein
VTDQRLQQRRRPRHVETVEPELAQARGVEPRALLVARCEQHRDALVTQPAGREDQRLARRRVEPVRVVHEHGHGALARDRREQAQRRRVGREAIDRAGRLQAERGRQRLPLARGHLMQLIGDRRQQRREPCERQALLRREGTHPEQPHVGRLVAGVRQQRALADARLAAQDERAACACARGSEQPVDRRELRCTTHQHLPIVRAWPSPMEMNFPRCNRTAANRCGGR